MWTVIETLKGAGGEDLEKRERSEVPDRKEMP